MIEAAPTLFKITEIDIVYRSPTKPSERPRITNSRDSHLIFQAAWDDNKLDLCEQVMIMLLDRGNRALGVSLISTGGISGAIIDRRMIFATALKARACGIVLAHNHPSGMTRPSPADIKATKVVSEAGKILEIPLLDHLIIARDQYYSFADEGLVL